MIYKKRNVNTFNNYTCEMRSVGIANALLVSAVDYIQVYGPVDLISVLRIRSIFRIRIRESGFKNSNPDPA